MLLLLVSSSRAVWVVLQPCGLTHVPQWLFQVPLFPGAVGWRNQSCFLLCSGLRLKGVLLSQISCTVGSLGLLGPLTLKGCICHSLPCSTAVLSNLNPQHCNCNCNSPAITYMHMHDTAMHPSVSSLLCLLQGITKISIKKRNSQKVFCYIVLCLLPL